MTSTLSRRLPLSRLAFSRLAPLLWAALALLLLSAAPSRGAEPSGGSPGGVRLLWFTSANCGPCQQIRPHVERMAADRLPVFKVDTAARPDVMRQYNVTGVPTFVLEAGGREAWRGVGVPGGDARGTADRMRSRLTRALADARRYGSSGTPFAGGSPDGRRTRPTPSPNPASARGPCRICNRPPAGRRNRQPARRRDRTAPPGRRPPA